MTTHYLEEVASFMKTAQQAVDENKISQHEAFQQINQVLQNVIYSRLGAMNHALHNVVSLQNESFARLRRIAELEAENNRLKGARPKIVCLCGSTRFMKQFTEANRAETLKGNVVLSVGCDLKGDIWFDQFSAYEMEQIKGILDPLHLEKIKLADEVLVININGYIGESTRKEIEFAKSLGKLVRYLEK